MSDTLSPMEEKFCLLYLENGGNGSKAAREAGYAPKAAAVTSSKLLKRPRVAAHLETLRNLVAHKLAGNDEGKELPQEVTEQDRLRLKELELAVRESAVTQQEALEGAADRLVEKVRDRLAAIALTPLTSLMRWGPDGAAPIPSSELTPDQAASVSKVKVKVREAIKGSAEGDGEELILHRETEFELAQHNPIAAGKEILELLGAKKQPDQGAAGAGVPRVAIYVMGGPTGLEVAAQVLQQDARPAPVAIVPPPPAALELPAAPQGARPWNPTKGAARAVVVSPPSE